MFEGHVWIGWKTAEASQQIHKNKVLLSAPPVLERYHVTECQSKREIQKKSVVRRTKTAD